MVKTATAVVRENESQSKVAREGVLGRWLSKNHEKLSGWWQRIKKKREVGAADEGRCSLSTESQFHDEVKGDARDEISSALDVQKIVSFLRLTQVPIRERMSA